MLRRPLNCDTKTSRCACAVTVLVVIGTAPMGAVADMAADSANSTNDAQLTEVIVTAQKRTQDTKDVPVSIGVIDAAMLQDLHVTSMEDVTRLTPGVSFAHASVGAANGPGQDVISIRGVSSTVGNPTVGTYIDEVPVITITGYEGSPEPMLVDIDRIEVLRGPQGTLYGASSEGGTVRFIPDQRLDRIIKHAIIGSDLNKAEIPFFRRGFPNKDRNHVDVIASRVARQAGPDARELVAISGQESDDEAFEDCRHVPLSYWPGRIRQYSCGFPGRLEFMFVSTQSWTGCVNVRLVTVTHELRLFPLRDSDNYFMR